MSLAKQQVPNTIHLNDREQIQYLLSNPPTWMMQYGISAISILFLLLLVLSYYIHYPDIVKGKVVLTTSNPPIRLFAKSGGRVTELLIKDQQIVGRGQVLGVIENSARWRDVLLLDSLLGNSYVSIDVFPDTLLLGELQDVYSIYCQHHKNMRYFLKHNGVAERIGYLKKQIEHLEVIFQNIQKQKMTLQSRFILAEKEYHRQRQFHQERIISDKEFEISESKYLEEKEQMEGIESVMTQNRIQIKQLEGQINDLEQGKADKQNEQELTLAEDIHLLRSAIAEWKQSFLIVAPIAGRVSFSKVWSAQQSVSAGEEILAVVPNPGSSVTMSSIVGKASISSENSGKIMKGQKAIIRLDGYPAQQFGTLEAAISDISLLPQKNEEEEAYLLNLQLSDTLITSYNKVIAFRQEMTGDVSIITEDRRVIDRIFGKLRDLIQNP